MMFCARDIITAVFLDHAMDGLLGSGLDEHPLAAVQKAFRQGVKLRGLYWWQDQSEAAVLFQQF